MTGVPLRAQRRETDRRGAEPGAASKGALPRISRVHGVEGGELEPRQAVRPSARAHTYAGGAPVSAAAAAAIAGGSEIADRRVGSNTAMPYKCISNSDGNFRIIGRKLLVQMHQ